MEDQRYLELIKQRAPKTRHLRTMIAAFFVGGFICCIGQAFNDLCAYFFPALNPSTIKQIVPLVLVVLATLLTCIGIYDKIGEIGGAGSIIPITGFANSIISPAIEHKREGIINGVCANMFKIAGPVLVIGIVASVLSGIIALVLKSVT
ncbi:MAG: SpoVA/SpoVAEb family sporulation membrane protein [Christensenellaceae bacterium]|nr:SpoVA/SpoVAEb family sporulation membrane protein [Christensenellaceae bacterium]